MNKSEALQMVIQMLERGEIETETGMVADLIDTIGTFRVKPFKFAGVEIPHPLSREELEKLVKNNKACVYHLSSWGGIGIDTVDTNLALEYWGDNSILYDTKEKALQAVEAIRAYESDSPSQKCEHCEKLKLSLFMTR